MDTDLQKAIALIKSGDKKSGGQMLAEIVKKDSRNENAWLWLSSCVNSNEQRIYCLKKVLEIEPNHNLALSTLSKLQQTEQSTKKEVIGKPSDSQQSISNTQPKPLESTTSNTKAGKFVKDTLNKLTHGEKTILFTLIGIVFLLVVCGGIILITDSAMKPTTLVSAKPTYKSLPTLISTITLTLTPTKIPLNTPTRNAPTNAPLSMPTTAQIPTPTTHSFFPSLPSVAINSQNYPQIYDPQSYIQNPEKYRDSRLSITLYVVDLVNVRVNGEKQLIVSLNTEKTNSPYAPVLAFGIASTYSYVNIFEIGDIVTIYGIGMGRVDGQTLDNLFGKYVVLPYMVKRNWSVACILGESYFVH